MSLVWKPTELENAFLQEQLSLHRRDLADADRRAENRVCEELGPVLYSLRLPPAAKLAAVLYGAILFVLGVYVGMTT